MCSSPSASQYVTAPCTATTNTQFDNKATCAANQYITGYSAQSPGVCNTCSSPSGSQYVTAVCSATVNTQFGNKTTCAAGNYATGYNAGAYNATGSAGTCTACPAGSYSDAGASSCILCPGGYYSSVVGASSCSSCPAGSYSGAVGATTSAVCTPCALSRYSSAGAAVCSYCPITQTTYATGSTSCVNCDVTKVPAGYVFDGANCAIRQCYAGYACTRPEPGFESTCPIGTYSLAGNYDLNCTPCPGGTKNKFRGSTSCPLSCGTLAAGYVWTSGCMTRQCTAGYYCPNANTETVCPSGTYSDAGASSCITCSLTCTGSDLTLAQTYYEVAWNSQYTMIPNRATKVNDTTCDVNYTYTGYWGSWGSGIDYRRFTYSTGCNRTVTGMGAYQSGTSAA